MSRVTIVDYGAGNLLSVVRAFRHLSADVSLAARPEDVAKAERLVLPGVGAFGSCMASLRACSLAEAVCGFAQTGKPLLGICVGMQMLFDESEEFGLHEGLGLIPGRVARISNVGADGTLHKVPHIGWNAVFPPNGRTWVGSPLGTLNPGTSMYFVHSFACQASDANHRLAECDYDGIPLLAVTCKENIVGCQFHPEKSGGAGLAMLSCFLG